MGGPSKISNYITSFVVIAEGCTLTHDPPFAPICECGACAAAFLDIELLGSRGNLCSNSCLKFRLGTTPGAI